MSAMSAVVCSVMNSFFLFVFEKKLDDLRIVLSDFSHCMVPGNFSCF